MWTMIFMIHLIPENRVGLNTKMDVMWVQSFDQENSKHQDLVVQKQDSRFAEVVPKSENEASFLKSTSN